MKPIIPIGALDNLPELPPIPALPEPADRRHAAVRAFAARLVGRFGIATAGLLAAELDEAVADEAELVTDRITKGPPR